MTRLIAAILLVGGLAIAGAGAPVAAHPVHPADRSAEAPLATVADSPSDYSPHLSAPVATPEEVPGSPLAMTGALLAIGALFSAIAARRRVVALVLALVLLVLTFESAVHSVHHLGSTDGSKCPVASAATHVQGTVGEPVIALTAPVSSVDACAVETLRLAALPWRAWRGRAPPSIPTS